MRMLASILVVFTLWCRFVIPADDVTALTPLQFRLAQLEAGVQEAEAIRAVKRLQYAYGHYAELGLWHDLADLFADSGVGHYPAGDLGREDIRKLFLQEVGKGKLGLAEGQFYPHIMLQPVVTLAPDGKTAKGRWRVLAMLGSYGGNASWAGGIYENEYVLENGVWKIRDLHYYSRFSGRYDGPGWTADQAVVPIHYDPALAGHPNPDTPSPPLTSATSTPAAMDVRIRDLQQRAERLSDEGEVQNLQRIYGYYVDRKMWDDAAALFADDATMELGQQGVYAGKKSIRRALDQFGLQGLREGELNDHLQLQIIVHVARDGMSAKARGVELIMSGINGAGGQWEEGIFENEYVKQKGVWRIKSLHYYPRLITDYDKGWAKDAKPAPGPSKDFPPDRPPTEVHEIFPKFSVISFHFSNPVTGLPPRYSMDVPDRRVATAFEVSAGPATNPADTPTAAELAGRIAEAERLLKIALAYDAAENLASAYGYYLDEFMWDETADLFARDGRRDLSTIGVEVGREQIRQSLKKRYPGAKPKVSFTAHQLVQPVIHVSQDGQSARMRVRLFQLGSNASGSGYWLAGVYETETVTESGVWKFSSMDLDYVWAADYKGGWAGVDNNTGIRKLVPAPFPKIIDLPFHYRK